MGDLPDELLLCPVRALRVNLARTASLPSRPRSLFISPRPLSKNALSFFIWDVIAESYSSAGLSLPSVSTSSASSPSSSRPRSSVHADGVWGVASSWACLLFWRPLPGLRLVFTSFYLSDVQFSSSRGFSLGLVVAAVAVVYFLFVVLDRLSSWYFSLLFQLGGECPWGEHSTLPRVFRCLGAPWVLSCPLESLGGAHSLLW